MLHRALHLRSTVKTPSNGRAKILIIVIVALIVLLAEVQIVLSAQIATTGEKIKNIESNQQELTLEINRLQVEINKVSSLSYIEKKAKEEFGMMDGVNKVEYISGVEQLAILQY